MGSMGIPVKSKKPPKGLSPRFFLLLSLCEPRSVRQSIERLQGMELVERSVHCGCLFC